MSSSSESRGSVWGNFGSVVALLFPLVLRAPLPTVGIGFAFIITSESLLSAVFIVTVRVFNGLTAVVVVVVLLRVDVRGGVSLGPST